MKEKDLRVTKDKIVYLRNRGIALIYLITIIALILTAVSVTVVMLVNKSNKQSIEKNEYGYILEFSNESITENIQTSKVNMIIQAENEENQIGEELLLPKGLKITDRIKNWSDKVIAITDGKNIIPIPKEYEVSQKENESNIKDGIVIKDKIGNEFVWIPVSEKLSLTYEYASYSEPTELTSNDIYDDNNLILDSQESLDYYYGKGYYNYSTDFAYKTHYKEMVESVNKYGGFYVGRHETTIDEKGNIGSKPNTSILSMNTILKEGNNANTTDKYYYRWWGLYNSQRDNNITGNGEYIQTNMIWGQQCNLMLKYIGNMKCDYSDEQVKNIATEKKIQKTTEALYLYNKGKVNDKIYNIYDLRRNAYEATGFTNTNVYRMFFGGAYEFSYPASHLGGFYATRTYDSVGSRLTLYIK